MPRKTVRSSGLGVEVIVVLPRQARVMLLAVADEVRAERKALDGPALELLVGRDQSALQIPATVVERPVPPGAITWNAIDSPANFNPTIRRSCFAYVS